MEYVGVTCATVLKVLLAGMSGSIVAVFLPGGEQSIRDLNFVSSNLFASTFAFGNLIKKFTIELVVQSAVVLFTSLVTLATGYVSGVITAKLCCSKDVWMEDLEIARQEAEGQRAWEKRRKEKEEEEEKKAAEEGNTAVAASVEVEPAEETPGCMANCGKYCRATWHVIRSIAYDTAFTPSPRDYHGLYIVCLSLQNTGTFPIALLQSMVGQVSWFNREAYEVALSAVFAYQCIWNVYIWSLGMRVLQRSAKHRNRHHLALEQAKEAELEMTRESMTLEGHRTRDIRSTLRRATEISAIEGDTEEMLLNKSSHFVRPAALFGSSVAEYPAGKPHDGGIQSPVTPACSPSSHGLLFPPAPPPSEAPASTEDITGIRMTPPTGEETPAHLQPSSEPTPAAEDVPAILTNMSMFTDTDAQADGLIGSEDESSDDEPIVYPDIDIIAGSYDSWYRLSSFTSKIKSSAYINLPLMSSVLGMIFGILCSKFHFMSWFFFESPMNIIIGGINLVGDGSIPLTLVVLGANLAMCGLEPLKRVDRRFIVVCTVVRLFIVPILNYGFYFLCYWLGILPKEASLRLAMWVEMMTPTAIMVSNLCCIHNTLPAETSALLLVQNVVAVLSTTVWLSIFLWMESSQ